MADADVSTFPDLDVSGNQIDDDRAVAECALRRLMSRNGSIDYDTDAGYDLRDLINEDLTPRELVRHSFRAGIEVEKDERVRSAQVSIEFGNEPFTLKVRISFVLMTGRTLALTASIDKISAQILSLNT